MTHSLTFQRMHLDRDIQGLRSLNFLILALYDDTGLEI